jgi:4-carboxymuconolactone decarboxylase
VTEGERHERYLAVRREVLGDAHVDRSLAAVSEFARPIQEYVTRAAWGEIWSRPGLDRRTRSLINLAMLTALNRDHELAVHVRGDQRLQPGGWSPAGWRYVATTPPPGRGPPLAS